MDLKIKEGFKGERALVLPPQVVLQMENNPLTSQIMISDIGYYPNAKYHFRERPEPISQYVLLYCIEGRGWFQTDGPVHNLEKDQLVILPAGIPHRYGADEENPWTIYWVHFKGSIAEYLSEGMDTPVSLTPGIMSRIKDRNDLFEEIYNSMTMGFNIDNLCYACSAFLHYLSSIKYVTSYRYGITGDAVEQDIVPAAIHYMEENIEKKLSLSDITSHIGYSQSHFSLLFRKQTGYSPSAFFNHLKIQRACHLLNFTDMKINQICYKVGIDDCYYFSRLFSKIMGTSPEKYRKQLKG